MTPNTITLPVQELKTVLPGFAKVLSKSSTVPVLRCLRFFRDEAGIVRLQGTDLDSHLTCKMAGEYPGEALSFLIPFDALNRAVKSASVKEGLGFTLESTERVALRSVVSNTPIEEVINTQPLGDWPLVPMPEGAGTPVDEYFKEALKEALSCVSSESSRYILNGACLDTQDKNAHYLVGTDGRHLYAANSFTFPFKEPVIIPGRKFLLWPAFSEDGPWAVHIQSKSNSTWVQVASPRWEFVTKAIEGNYPNWKQIVPQEAVKSTVQLTPEGCKRILDLLPRIPGNDSPTKTLALFSDGKEFRLGGRHRGSEPFTEFIVPEGTVSGAPFEVFINREYWGKALAMGLLQIEVRENHGFVVCRAERKKMVIAPLKGEAPPAPAPVSSTPPPPSPGPNTSTAAAEPPVPPPTSSSAASPAGVPSENQAQPQPQPQPQPTATQQSTTETTTHQSNPSMNPNQTTNTTTATSTGKPQRNSTPPSEPKPSSALERLLIQVEGVRTSLRQVMSELNETVSLLKAVERENRATEKEVEGVRSTLRSLQKVTI
jgi:DNA polymerase III sliding clamp (beta) subunit (PCNA family)